VSRIRINTKFILVSRKGSGLVIRIWIQASKNEPQDKKKVKELHVSENVECSLWTWRAGT